MAQNRILMPGNQGMTSKGIAPLAAQAIGSYFGGPIAGQAAGQVTGSYVGAQGGQQGIQSGGGVQNPNAKPGVGQAAMSAVGNYAASATQQDAGAKPAGTSLMDQQKTGSPYELPEQKIPENSYGPAMERRQAALDAGDQVSTLENSKAALKTLPEDMQKEFGPYIDKALHQAKASKPQRGVAMNTHYNKSYGSM